MSFGWNKITFYSLVVLTTAYFYYGQRQWSHSLISPKEGWIVETRSGQIRGILSESRDGREFESWLGVPYSQPPVGNLRFKSPQPVEKWRGILDGTKYRSQCARLDLSSLQVVGEEDCLFLNIHVPLSKLENGHKKLLPVLAFIHEGGFYSSGGNDFTPEFFMDEDVVLVTLNYRLSILGFLNLGDETIRGNMGLKDQLLALKWIQNNIKYFGGDNSKVTICGNSAGGASVNYMMLAEEKTRGLFQKAISMSGSAMTPWSFSPSAKSIEKGQSLVKDLPCPINGGSHELIQCLQNLDVVTLHETMKQDMKDRILIYPHKNGEPLTPTVESVDDEEAFLTQSPYDIGVQGKASRVPYLTGVVANEGLLSSPVFYREDDAMEIFEKNWNQIVQHHFHPSDYLPARPPSEKDAHSSKLRQFYFGDSTSLLSFQEKIDRFTDLMSDAFFTIGSTEMASIFRQFSPVFLYVYDRPGGPSAVPDLAARNGWPGFFDTVKSFICTKILGQPPPNYGHSSHGEELAMLFPHSMFPTKVDGRDKDCTDYKFSKDMVKLWTDFVKDEITPQFRGKKLLQANKNGTMMYLRLDEVSEIVQEPFANRTALWRSIKFSHRYASTVNQL